MKLLRFVPLFVFLTAFLPFSTHAQVTSYPASDFPPGAVVLQFYEQQMNGNWVNGSFFGFNVPDVTSYNVILDANTINLGGSSTASISVPGLTVSANSGYSGGRTQVWTSDHVNMTFNNIQFDPGSGQWVASSVSTTKSIPSAQNGYGSFGLGQGVNFSTAGSMGGWENVVFGSGGTYQHQWLNSAFTATVWYMPPQGQTVAIDPASVQTWVGQSVSFNASGGQNGYIWGNSASGGGTTNTLTFSSPGTYYVTAYSPDGSGYYQSNTATTTINVTPGPLSGYYPAIQLSPQISGPVVYGTNQVMTATATGDGWPLLETKLRASTDGGNTWTVLQDDKSFGNPNSDVITNNYNFAAGSVIFVAEVWDTNPNSGWNYASTTETVTVNTTVTATANPSSEGIVTGSGTYAFGANATLRATAIGDNHFVSWSGGVSSTTNPLTVPVNSNLTVTGNFAPNLHNLMVSSIGSGSVTGSGSTYVNGTVVPITAAPSPGWSFTGWTVTGATVASASSAVTTVTMGTINASAVANFVQLNYTVTVTSSPAAGGTMTGAGTYHYGDTVTITATPHATYNFNNFSGDVVSSTNPYSQTITGNLNVVANFSLINYILTTSVSGAGLISPNTSSYVVGTNVAVFASASAGNYFSGWSGNVPAAITSQSPEPLSFTITMNGNESVTAVFQPMMTQTITFPLPNGGLVSVDGGPYPLSATATSGLPVSYSIVSGPGSIVGNSLVVTGAGSIVIMASQPGNTYYFAATPVDDTVTAFAPARSYLKLNNGQSQSGTNGQPTDINNAPGSPFYQGQTH